MPAENSRFETLAGQSLGGKSINTRGDQEEVPKGRRQKVVLKYGPKLGIYTEEKTLSGII